MQSHNSLPQSGISGPILLYTMGLVGLFMAYSYAVAITQMQNRVAGRARMRATRVGLVITHLAHVDGVAIFLQSFGSKFGFVVSVSDTVIIHIHPQF